MPLIVIFAGTAVILLFLLIFKDHEIRNIKKQIRLLSGSDGNGLIHSAYGFRTQNELINSINDLLRELRSIRVEYCARSHNLEQMMTNISHDLRTPLTSAMGYIDLIQRSGISEEEKKRELAIIEKRLGRLEELINSFFELSQVVSSGKEPEKTDINLVSVLEEAIVHYYDDYSDRDRQIIFECSRRKLMICSNRNMLLRIFDNLINNALKHGAGDLKITAGDDEGISIIFTNTLISSDIDIEHIFDEFYTTDISRTKGNTGLGLAIAKQFTEMLGGEIGASLVDELFILTIRFNRPVQ